MKSIKIICLLAALFVVAILFVGYFPVKAQEDDGVNVHVKVEVSTDGVTWFNYAGTETSGDATLTANPGDTIFARAAIWNTGVGPARALTASGSFTGTSYMTIMSTNLDADDDGNPYTGSFFAGAGTGVFTNLAAGTQEANAQMATATIKLDDSFPAGTTAITGQVTIDSYAAVASLPHSLVSRALAAGINRVSSFRIAVTVTQPAANDTTDNTSDDAATETTEELPSTGCDCLN